MTGSDGLPAAGADSQADIRAVDPGIQVYDTISMPQHTTNSYRRGRQNAAFTKPSSDPPDEPNHVTRSAGYKQVVDEIKQMNGIHPAVEQQASSNSGKEPDVSYG